MASGSGSTLGAALADLFAHGGRAGGARARYDRQGWRAQFSQMAKSKSGYAAMEAAGLSATTRTQRGWLSGDVDASKANQGMIAEAYRAMQGGWSPRFESATFAISGLVTIGSRDSRDRGSGRSAPLRIDGSRGDWDEIEDEWNAGGDPERLEALFIENVIMKDLDFSFPPEFNGDWYEVTA